MPLELCNSGKAGTSDDIRAVRPANDYEGKSSPVFIRAALCLDTELLQKLSCFTFVFSQKIAPMR